MAKITCGFKQLDDIEALKKLRVTKIERPFVTVPPLHYHGISEPWSGFEPDLVH